MSDDTTNSEETEISNITDAYGEAIEYDGNPAHAEGYLAAMDEFFLNSEYMPLFEHHAAGDIDGVQVVSQACHGGEVGEALGDDGAKDG